MVSHDQFQNRLAWRHRISRGFAGVCIVSTWFGLLVLAVLLTGLSLKATGIFDPTEIHAEDYEPKNWITKSLLTNHVSRKPEQSGILAGMWGSFWLMVMTACISVPLGVGAAIFLEEYAKESWFTRLIRLNISNLAGVPSIVFGILGLTVFARMLSLVPEPTNLGLPIPFLGMIRIPIPFGSSLLTGALTMSLLILPIIIIASQEALRSVPQSIRHGSLALGATKWQTIWRNVLPASLPGIMTGVILAMSRALGETAPLIVIGAKTYIGFCPGKIESVTTIAQSPQSLLEVPASLFTAIPIQIYDWVSNQPNPEFRNAAAAAIVVLLVVLLIMNGLAVYIRHHFREESQLVISWN